MVPVQKQSKARKRARRSHHALRAPQYSSCRQCGSPKLTHVACGACGFYTSKLAVKQPEVVADED